MLPLFPCCPLNAWLRAAAPRCSLMRSETEIVLCRHVGQVRKERGRMPWGNPSFCTNTAPSELRPGLQQTNKDSWVLADDQSTLEWVVLFVTGLRTHIWTTSPFVRICFMDFVFHLWWYYKVTAMLMWQVEVNTSRSLNLRRREGMKGFILQCAVQQQEQ